MVHKIDTYNTFASLGIFLEHYTLLEMADIAARLIEQKLTAAFLSHGQISSTDAKAALNTLLLYPREKGLVEENLITEDRIAAAYNSADADYNGVMTFNEFTKMVDTVAREVAAERYIRDLKIVQAIDTDKSGFIERDEIRKFVESKGLTVTEEIVENIFKRLDVTKDGKVNYVEFLCWMKNVGLF